MFGAELRRSSEESPRVANSDNKAITIAKILITERP
jgi:hypothetical protein